MDFYVVILLCSFERDLVSNIKLTTVTLFFRLIVKVFDYMGYWSYSGYYTTQYAAAFQPLLLWHLLFTSVGIPSYYSNCRLRLT